MSRFFHPQALHIGAIVELPERVAHHVRVVRLCAGDHITLFNGQGGEYTATLISVDKKHASVDINTFSAREAELPYAVTLAQALPEATKMDWVIEKAVELGAVAIQPLAAQRCVTRLSTERAEKKVAHWRGIVISACEQSGRNRVPHVGTPIDFEHWAGQSQAPARILFSPRAKRPLTDWARQHPPQPITLTIGPEGGFTEREEDIAVAQGAILLSLGERILRTETAGVAAISAINALWGGM